MVDSVMEVVKPWSDGFVVEQRFVWLRCYGIPFSLWNKDCFSKVLGKEASLVAIDEAIEFWDNLEYTRILVRLRKVRFARFLNCIRINGHVFNIYLKEKHPYHQ